MKRLLVAASILAATAAVHAESQYGFGTAANITAQSRLGITVNVPKLILLRIGSVGATQDQMTFDVGASIPATPTSAVSGTLNGALTWDGNAPTFSATGTGNTNIAVSAFSNATGAALQCAVPTWAPATGGPANTQIGITTNAGLAHPGGATPTLNSCGSSPTSIPAGTVQTASWTYAVTATNAQIAAWTPGSYSATLTYTATAP